MNKQMESIFRSRLCPTPVHLEFQDGDFFRMQDHASIQLSIRNGMNELAIRDIVLRECSEYWNCKADVECVFHFPSNQLPPEGYRLKVESSSIFIESPDAMGIRNALKTLRQLAETERGVRIFRYYAIPCCSIEDFPAMAFRGIHLCWFPETSFPEMEKQIRLAAYLKMNFIVLEPWGVFPFECEPDFCWPDCSVPRSDWRRILSIAHDLGLTVIPQLNTLGHAFGARGYSGKHAVLDFAPQYASLFEPDGWSWCLSNPETRKSLKNMILEMHDFFGRPPYFHVGCDEAYTAGTCSLCQQHSVADLLKDQLLFFHDILAERDTRMMLWHDMFLDREDPRFQSIYVATGSKEKGFSRLLGELPRDLIFCDWEYCGVPDQTLDFEWASTRHLMEYGYDTILCPWNRL